MSAWLEGFRTGNDTVTGAVDRATRWSEMLKDRKERDEAKKLAADDRHHQRNVEASNASEKTYQDYLKQGNYESEAGLRASSQRVNLAYAKNLEKGLTKEGGNPNEDNAVAARLKALSEVIDVNTESARSAGSAWYLPAAFEKPEYEPGQEEIIAAAKAKRDALLGIVPQASPNPSDVAPKKPYQKGDFRKAFPSAQKKK